MIRRGRLLSGALLLAALTVVALASSAGANHSNLALVSQGTIGGADPFVAYYPLGGTSVNGEYAFFETDEQLLTGDTDTSFDVYQRLAGATSRVSQGPAGGNGDPTDVFFDATSDDGTHVFFETDEKLTSGAGGDTDAQFDIYDRFAGSTTRISAGTGATGNGAYDVFFDRISTDGSRAFFTTAESLVATDTDNCFGDGCDDVYQRSGGTTALISTGTPGNAAFPATFVGASQNGTRVFFETEEKLSASDTDSRIDVYERSGGTTTLISVGTPGNGPYDAFFEGTSQDGTEVFFSTGEPLVVSDTDDCDPSVVVLGCTDVYQGSAGTSILISTGSPGNGAFNATFDGNSQDGGRVFFHTREGLVGTDTDGQTDVYQRSSATTTQISTGSTGGNGATFAATFEGNSADGSRVFLSTAEKLEATDTDSVSDVYQRQGSTTKQLTIGATGGNGATAAFFDGNSADGTRVFFSTAEILEPVDTDGSIDIYERRSNTATSLISIGPNGGNGATSAFFDEASDDGAHVFFSTSEKLINPPDTDNSTDIYDAEAPVGYARPTSASPLNIKLVPAYEECVSPTGTHGPPLVGSSCSPPAQASDFLTIGAPEANGLPSKSAASVHFKVLGESPIDLTNGDQADVEVTFLFNDVRTQGSPYLDYSGELQGVLGLRITDLYNGPTLTAPATVIDLDIPFTVACSPTLDTTVGSTCNLMTTIDTLTAAETVKERQRAIWETRQFKVFDGGPDGDVDTANNTLFAVQGTFAP